MSLVGVSPEPMSLQEKEDMLMYFDKFRKMGLGKDECYKRIAAILGRSEGTIGVAIRRLTPTTRTARLYLQSKAYKLARRLVEKANTAEIIDILSRPSMGVLDPAKKSESGMGGFFLTVSADTCGAVKVGMLTGNVQDPEPEQNVFDVEIVEKEAEHEATQTLDQSPARSFTKSSATQDAIRDAQVRLGLARQRLADRRVRQEFARIQGHHGLPQTAESIGVKPENRKTEDS